MYLAALIFLALLSFSNFIVLLLKFLVDLLFKISKVKLEFINFKLKILNLWLILTIHLIYSFVNLLNSFLKILFELFMPLSCKVFRAFSQFLMLFQILSWCFLINFLFQVLCYQVQVVNLNFIFQNSLINPCILFFYCLVDHSLYIWRF